jgi:hypothetical protein
VGRRRGDLIFSVAGVRGIKGAPRGVSVFGLARTLARELRDRTGEGPIV